MPLNINSMAAQILRITIIGDSPDLTVVQHHLFPTGAVVGRLKFSEAFNLAEIDCNSEIVILECQAEAAKYLGRLKSNPLNGSFSTVGLVSMEIEPGKEWNQTVPNEIPDYFIKWPSTLTEFQNSTKLLVELHALKYRLQASQNHLKKAQRQAHLGSWELDLTTKTGVWSDEMFRLFNFDPVAGAPTFEEFLAVVHPEDRALVVASHTSAIASGLPFALEYRIQTGTKMRWLQARGQTVRDEKGTALQLHGTSLDITDRKLAEQAHQESERLLRETSDKLSRVLNSSLDAICTFDKEGRFLQVSAACKKIWGYDPHEL
ncbi:MAG: signal transduction histidine kinase, partial [Verrucomicrobiales bacterium]|nr:signal transduction histidine kinase [Verrucomicrobiales bacterium]